MSRLLNFVRPSLCSDEFCLRFSCLSHRSSFGYNQPQEVIGADLQLEVNSMDGLEMLDDKFASLIIIDTAAYTNLNNDLYILIRLTTEDDLYSSLNITASHPQCSDVLCSIP